MSETSGERESGRLAWVRSVMDEHEDSLTRYAHRLTGDGERARDVVQDVFLSLCRVGDRGLNGKMPAWLYTVCRNKALDVRRKETRMSVMTETATAVVAGASSDPALMAESKDGVSRALSMLATLPENQQEVVRLKFQGGLSYKEIAAVTSLSVSNVGYLIHVAIKALRDGLGEELA